MDIIGLIISFRIQRYRKWVAAPYLFYLHRFTEAFLCVTVLSVATRRDRKTFVQMVPRSRPVDNSTYCRLVWSRPADMIHPVALNLPVPLKESAVSVRFRNLPLPSHPLSKPALTVPSRCGRHSLLLIYREYFSACEICQETAL